MSCTNKLWLQVRLGKNGIEEVLGLGPISTFEQQYLEAMKTELKSSIEKGVKFSIENRVKTLLVGILVF